MQKVEAGSRDAVLQQLGELIAAARPKIAGAIRPDARLTRDLGLDSLAMVEIVVGVEERFGLSTGNFEDLDLDQVRTVGDLADVIAGRLAASHR